MKKTAYLLVLVLFCNICLITPAQGQNNQEIKDHIACWTEKAGLTDAEVDSYLNRYDNSDDFIRELITYLYYKDKTGFQGSLEDYLHRDVIAQAAAPAVLSAVPDNGITERLLYDDSQRYSRITQNEKMNYSTGKMMYEDLDLSLPGVNGLDFSLVSRFNQDDSPTYNIGYVPVSGTSYYSNWVFNRVPADIFENCFGVSGWSFAFSYVRFLNDDGYLHLSSGEVYNIGEKDANGKYELERYPRNDIELYADNGSYTSGTERSYSYLRHKNGTREYFNSRGDLIGIVDRYGNQIQFFYTNYKLSSVIDSAGRNITFNYTYPTTGVQTGTLRVNVDGQELCRYTLDTSFENAERKVLRSKITPYSTKLFYYDLIDVPFRFPITNNACSNEIFVLSSVVNYEYRSHAEYIYETDYEKVYMDNGSVLSKCYPRTASRKDVSDEDETRIANFSSYSYTGNFSDAVMTDETSQYSMTETINDTGAKIERIYNYKRLLHFEFFSNAKNEIFFRNLYSYDIYDLVSSLTKIYYQGSDSRTEEELFSHDAKGNTTFYTDVLGKTTTYQYDADTNVLLEQKEPYMTDTGATVSRYIKNTLDSNGNVLEKKICIETPTNVLKTYFYTYDTYGNLLSERDDIAGYATRTYTYSEEYAHALPTQIKEDNKIIASYTYDNLGNVTASSDGLGHVTTYEYNESGDVVSITYPDTGTEKNLYAKDLGYIYSSDIHIGIDGANQKLTYDPFGRTTAVYDIPLSTSSFSFGKDLDYNALRDQFYTAVFLPQWRVKEQYTYDGIGRIAASTNANGTTAYEYDDFNRVTKVIHPDLSERSILYDDVNLTKTVIDEEGKMSTATYDSLGRQLSSSMYPDANTVCTATTVYKPYSSDLVQSQTDANGNTTTYTYDALDRRISTQNALGDVFAVTYDEQNMQDIYYYPDSSTAYTQLYDEHRRLSGLKDQNNNLTSYEYDNADNLKKQTARNGNITTYTYNDKNKIISKATEDTQYSYEYNTNSNLSYVYKQSDYAQATDYHLGYNMNGQKTSETLFYRLYMNGHEDAINDQTISYEYNDMDTLKNYSVQGSQWVDYSYDQLNRLTGIGQVTSADDTYATYTYYKNGLIKTEKMTGGITNTYEYDGANRLTRIVRETSQGARITSYTLNYDPNGNCIGVIKENVPLCEMYWKTYTYDALNRLISEYDMENETSVQYAYDNKNNMVSKQVCQNLNTDDKYTQTFSYTSATASDGKKTSIIRMNKMVNDLIQQYTDYESDLNGNIIKKSIFDANDSLIKRTEYTYDSENMMIQASVHDVGSDKTTNTYFDYDALGRRLHKQQEVTDENGRRWIDGTAYIWNGDKVVKEEYYKGFVSQDYPMLDEGISDSAPNVWGLKGLLGHDKLIFTFNQHGDADMVFTLYSSNKVKEYEYLTAFGEELNPDENDENPYRYCGENYDVETGLYYLRARYYDPELGRFLTEDPAMDGMNWFVYCNNNPVMFVDPLGEDAIIITNSEAAEKQGHTSAVYQDANGNWFYTYWGNKAAAVIRIPDEYMGDLNNFNSGLNKFLTDNGFKDITSDYNSSTYIVGDFTASLNAAYADVKEASTSNFLGIEQGLTSFDDGTLVFQGRNGAYGLLNVNCLDKTYASLSKGTLSNGMNVENYMKDLGFNGGLIPNNATPKFAEVFMNSSFTYSGAYGGLYNYAYYYSIGSEWAQRWQKANYANKVIGW